MPELPEVETIVREIAPRLRGRHIVSATVFHPRIVRFSKGDFVSDVSGARIEEVTRHGKFIRLRLSRGFLTIHLGMTGKILFDTPVTPYTRALLALDDSTLMYEDTRMFGSLEWTEDEGRTRALGPDAANQELSPAALKRKAPVKAVLLNQRVFSGVGNIYADEALFRAGIHPARRADRISAPRAAKLIAELRALLEEAIAFRGSSVSDYVDASGQKGGFQTRHRVYGREGLPCPVCATPVRRIVIGGRSSHYCPKCQR